MNDCVKKDIDFAQLNTTGMRIIILFSILLEAPRTLEEITLEYSKNPLSRSSVSDDTIRNDINALRDAGCVISRTTKINPYYALIEHPFELSFKSSYIKSLKNLYSKIYTKLTFNELFALDSLFQKLSSYSKDSKIKEELLKISKISNINKDILKDLINYSAKNCTITVMYKSQTGKLKEHELIAQKVDFRHDKLYFFCYDKSLNKNAFYKVENITEILDVKIDKSDVKYENFVAKYKILNVNKENYAFSKNEELVEVSGNDLIIKATAENDFIMMQNVLNFGRRCVVLEPIDFRNKIIDTIKSIREVYCNET